MALQKKNKVRPGAPTKLTPELQEKFCEYVKEGQFHVTCAHLCGISEESVCMWIKRGDTEGSGIYFDFAQAVRLADAEAEADCVRTWKAFDNQDYRSVKDRMRQRWRKRWGDETTKVELSGPNGSPIQTQDLSKLSVEELAQLKVLLAKAEPPNE